MIRRHIAFLIATGILFLSWSSSALSQNGGCSKTVYLTFDTGNMSVAQTVADILNRQKVRATFFLANEKTFRGDYALDDSWKTYWQERAREGHHFGSHTFDHDYFVKNGPSNQVFIKPQFGPKAGMTVLENEATFCRQIRKVDERFIQLTGQPIQKIWRAPGGKTSPRLINMGNECGYHHTAWAAAGFLGDELNSKTYPNALLLEKASREIQDGDITMAHLGIWSRKDPWAPEVLEPLIVNLKSRGFCFATLPKTGSPEAH